MNFISIFQTARGSQDKQPYEYQIRLACGDYARSDQPESLEIGRDCTSKLINIPTGLGKTADTRALRQILNLSARVQRGRAPKSAELACLPIILDIQTMLQQSRASEARNG